MVLVYVFISLLAATLVTGQSFITRPRNTAAERGTTARLNCTVDFQNDLLEWRHYLHDTTGDRIVTSDYPNNILDNNYDLDYDVDSGQYDLIIKSVSDELVGNYNCHILAANIKEEAQLVSLSSLDCNTEGDVSNVTVGTRLSLTCAVSYEGYKYPTLNWYSGNSYISGEYDAEHGTTKSVRYTAQITIEEKHMGTPFRCELDFRPVAGEIGEPPIYTDSCSLTFGESPDDITRPSTGSGRRVQHSSLTVTVLVFIIGLRKTFGYS